MKAPEKFYRVRRLHVVHDWMKYNIIKYINKEKSSQYFIKI